MSQDRHEALLGVLQARFEAHRERHAGARWATVLQRIAARPGALAALQAMETSGGEPDLVSGLVAGDALVFVDCAPESPAGRRSLCYDPQALASRKQHRPVDSAVGMAAAMGIALLTEAQYRTLQTLGEFDCRSSSWLLTPAELRGRGGALFGDRRYDRVFVYHNGAESYFAARGFRGLLQV